MNTLIHPLLQYVFLTAGLVLCTFLFLTLKQDLQRLRRRETGRQLRLEETLEQLRREIVAIQRGLADVEAKAATFPQFSPPKPGMNTSRRSQVLRMHRRGERPEQIAAALGLPQNEVDLLLKVQQAVQLT